MSRHRSKWVRVVAVLAICVALHSFQGASISYACTDCEVITNTPTVVLTMNGADQMVNSMLDFSLNNIETSGWHVTITSTQFTTGVHSLPTSASSITNVTAVCQPAQTCSSLPQNAITYPVAVPIAPSTAAFYDAQANTGIGTFDITAVLALTIPANAYRGMYTNTITLALATGP